MVINPVVICYLFIYLLYWKNGVESGWSVTDREGIAITMAMGNAPQAVAMELQKGYAHVQAL